MLFNSPTFLFIFLPIILVVYTLCANRYRNSIILFFSILFYTWGEKELIILLLASTVIDYANGIIIERGYRKSGLISSIIFNLGLLIYFKYSNFFIENIHSLYSIFDSNSKIGFSAKDIVLPLGISFYLRHLRYFLPSTHSWSNC